LDATRLLLQHGFSLRLHRMGITQPFDQAFGTDIVASLCTLHREISCQRWFGLAGPPARCEKQACGGVPRIRLTAPTGGRLNSATRSQSLARVSRIGLSVIEIPAFLLQWDSYITRPGLRTLAVAIAVLLLLSL